MKKILNALFVALLAVFTFSSCSDVPAPYEIIDPNNQGGGQGSGAEGSVVFLEETFATSQGDFTIDNKALPEGSKYVWSHKTYEGKAYMYASAFVGGSNKASESWLVSPEVNLTKATSASLTFEHAINKIAGDMKDQMTLWAKESSASDWTQLTIPVYPDGKSWTFVKAGVVDLSAYVGTKMQFALKYLSTTESAGAWEVKNIKLSGEGEKVEDDTPSQGEGMELLTNGGFENWQDGYPLTWKSASSASKATLTESTDKHSGEKSVMVEGSDKSNLRLASQEMTLKPGKYVFSAYFKAATENGASACLGYVPVTADNSAGQYVYGPYVNDITNADWKQGSYSFTLSEETRLCLVVMNAKKPGQNMLVDDASLKTADGGIVEGGEQPGPETPQGSVVFFEETFAQSQGAFTIDNKQLPEGSDHVWAWDSYNEKAYMKASAYVSSSAKESESWLISPVVDLTKATKATLTFDHAINKINGDKTHDMTLWVKESKGAEWTQLTISEYPAGTDWNFVSAGVMDLSAYKGKKMQFAFKYVSSTASCGTWEIKNVKVAGEGEKGDGGGTVEPEPEPQPTEGELIISEYVEGSSNNKYIELYNPTSKAIDLSGYKLRLSANGKVSTDGELIWNTQNDHQLEGTLEAGKTIVYKHKGAALNLSEGVEAIESAAANFNGNDPIALFKGDVLIDLFGVPSDKHDGQTPAKDFAKDKTFRRIASVTKPSKVYNSEEWESAAKDDVSGLGKR